MANIIHFLMLLITLSEMKARVMALSQCRNEILYTSLSTCAAVVVIMFILFIVYLKVKKKRAKGHRKKGSDIEGRRNKVFENDFCGDREVDKNLNAALSPRKKLSTPDLTSRRLPNGVIKKENVISSTPNKNHQEKNCVGTQTDKIVEIEEVTIEKKNFNSSGLEFGSAGIFIKNIDRNQILIKIGEIESGDEVIAMNDIQMDGLNDIEAFSHFARLGPVIKMKILKNTFIHKANKQQGSTQENNFSKKNPESSLSQDNTASEDNKTVPDQTLIESKNVKTEIAKVQINQTVNHGQSISQEKKEDISESTITQDNNVKNYDMNQNIILKTRPENIASKQHGKSRSAEENSTNTNGYITDYNKIASNFQSQNLLVAAARLNKSFDTNGNYFNNQNRLFKRARSEENLRPNKSNSFSRNRTQPEFLMSYEDYVRQIDLLQASNAKTNLSSDNVFTPSSLIGEKVVLQRGYNQDYITPINGSFSGIHLPIIQQPVSRIPANTHNFTPYNINCETSECFECLLKQKNTNETLNYSTSYDSTQLINNQNLYVKTDDNGLLYQNKEQIELDPDVMRYMTQKYSEPRLYRKDPPPYTSTHNTVTQTFTSSQSDLSNVDCTVIRRHPQKKINKQRPHSYTEAAMLKKENQKEIDETNKETNDLNDSSEKRKHPKRAHSMPAVKHLEGRPKVAKTFLENEPKQKTSRKVRQRSKTNQNSNTSRRKSIDSGTLQKLANEIKSDPSLEDEFPFISKLLGGGRLSPSERRNPALFRHKSTEELSSQF